MCCLTRMCIDAVDIVRTSEETAVAHSNIHPPCCTPIYVTSSKMVKLHVLGFLFIVTIGARVSAEVEAMQGCGNWSDADKWTSHKDGDCMGCKCDDNEEICENCGEVDVSPGLGCYLKTRDYNPNADFPDCCKEEAEICPGDESFDEQELATWEQNNTKRKK